MRLFKPGGMAWLLRHELLLSYRTMRAARGGRAIVLMGGGFVLLAVVVGLPLAAAAKLMRIEASPLFCLAVDGCAIGLFTLMLSQTMAAATTALYERGDLDLLLSSPLSGRKVLAVRGVGIALNPFLIYGAFAVPAVVPSAFVGRPAWLSVLPLMAAVAMLAASAGLGLAMALFALIGPRATRTVGQVMAGVIGASTFLIVQSRNFAPGVSASMSRTALAWATPERFSPASPLSWPARALLGSPVPLAAIVLISTAIFAGVLFGLGRRFVADAAISSGVADATPARTPVKAPRFSASPLQAIVRKEFRLLRRDPTLLSQVGLRVLFLLPLFFLMLRRAHGAEQYALAASVGLISVVAAQVAGSLAWITVSAEDAPELLAASPAGGALARGGKLVAALLPVAALLAAPLIVLAFLAPWAALCGVFGVTVSAASAALVNLWFEKPGSRSGFRKRSGSVVTGLAEFIVGAGWGVATGLAAAGQVASVAVALVVCVLLGGLYLMRNPERGY